MSSNTPGQFSYNGQTSIVEDKPPSKRPYFIGFIVFVVLAIGLIIFALWWFVWRDSTSPMVQTCTATNQCAPNEVCNLGTNQCNSVPCTKNSECGQIATGGDGGFCINGYCQTASCFGNTDCANLGDDFACVGIPIDPQLPSATPWITTACVKTGGVCQSNTDCYGGDWGLVCNKPEGSSTGVCVQCASNSDCSGGQVCDASVNLCTYCTDSSQCSSGGCYNGTCCSSPQYNNGTSCQKGELFDPCVVNSDCNSGQCVSLGVDGGTNDEIRVCGGGANGTMTFSAGSHVHVGDPTAIALLTCQGPGTNGIYDTTVTPFAVNGACSTYSVANSNIGAPGSTCGVPNFCGDPAHAANLLCNQQITFDNPFAVSCETIDDCDGLPGYGCATNGICSNGCSTSIGNTSCPIGFVCVKSDQAPSGSDGVCQYPASNIKCTTTACTDATKCQCPSGYGCNGNTCVWTSNTGGTTNPVGPPAPFVVDSVCSRPATALPQTNNGQLLTNNFIPAYCVNGSCNGNAGWINSVCVQDGDCMYLGDDPVTPGTRFGLNCEDRGGVSVCQ